MQPQPTLAMLLDDAALFSLEHQLHLTDVAGEHSWSVDLAVPEFSFEGPSPRTCAVHLLGTAAPGPQSWLWAWANPTDFPVQAVAVAEQVRAFGEYYGIALLRDPEVPFSALPPDRQTVIDAIAIFTDAAKVISGRWTSYNGQTGGGSRAAFLLEDADFALGPPDPPRIMRVLQQGLAGVPMTDHRRAIHSYAALRQLGITWSPDGRSATITAPRLRADIRFDEYGRVAGISGSLGG